MHCKGSFYYQHREDELQPTVPEVYFERIFLKGKETDYYSGDDL